MQLCGELSDEYPAIGVRVETALALFLLDGQLIGLVRRINLCHYALTFFAVFDLELEIESVRFQQPVGFFNRHDCSFAALSQTAI